MRIHHRRLCYTLAVILFYFSIHLAWNNSNRKHTKHGDLDVAVNCSYFKAKQNPNPYEDSAEIARYNKEVMGNHKGQ